MNCAVASENPDLETPALPENNSSADDGEELRDAGQSLLLLSIILIYYHIDIQYCMNTHNNHLLQNSDRCQYLNAISIT